MAIKSPPTRMTTNFVLCGLVLLIIFTRKVQLSTNISFTEHMNMIKQFPCLLPQPRSISVDQLIGDQLDTSEIARPHVTVLHRCDSGTGCCSQKSKICKVAELEEIDLHFYVKDTIRGTQGQFKEFKVKNHTRCSCQSISNDIK